MTDTAALRAALTHALQPHLPPQHVANIAKAVVANATLLHGAGQCDDEAAFIGRSVLALLPEPYRSAAAIAEAIAPVVSRWWQERLVEIESGSVTVTDHRP